MLEDIDVANINLRRMEKELLAARQTLWDQFFIACLPVAFRPEYGHHGKIAGVAAAAEMADEAMRVREIKNAAAHNAEVRGRAAFRAVPLERRVRRSLTKEKTMETGQLAAALRNKAAEVRNVNATTAEEDQTLRDAADLLRVLAHVVDGKPLAKAFGSPGDWGYETAIGAAIAAAPVTPNAK